MPRSHRYWRPEAHQKQRPQAGMNEAATWSPTASDSTPGSDLGHHAGALVATDHREHRVDVEDLEHLGRGAHVAGAEVLVGVAHAGVGHLDDHLVGTGRIDLDLLDLPRLVEPRTDGCARLHVGDLPFVDPGPGPFRSGRQLRARGVDVEPRSPITGVVVGPSGGRDRRPSGGGGPRRIRWTGAERPGPPRRRDRRSRSRPSRRRRPWRPRARPGPRSGVRDRPAMPRSAGHEGRYHLAPLGVADGRVGHQGGHGADQTDADAQLIELAGPEPVGGLHRLAQDIHHGQVAGSALELSCSLTSSASNSPQTTSRLDS